MGRRGPAPKPAKLRLLEGARPDHVNQHEPIPRQETPEAPSWLSPEARLVWDYTIAELEVMGLASTADRDALVCFCEAVIVHRRATAKLAISDVLIKSPHGQPIRNPAVIIQRDAARDVKAFAQEFGLSPSARARIQMRADDADDDDNPFAAAR